MRQFTCNPYLTNRACRVLHKCTCTLLGFGCPYTTTVRKASTATAKGYRGRIFSDSVSRRARSVLYHTLDTRNCDRGSDILLFTPFLFLISGSLFATNVTASHSTAPGHFARPHPFFPGFLARGVLRTLPVMAVHHSGGTDVILAVRFVSTELPVAPNPQTALCDTNPSRCPQ